MTKPVFAVDVGGVLASLQHDGPPQPGSLEAFRELQLRFDMHIVSQCGAKRARDTVKWLYTNGFYVPQQNQHYVGFKQSKVPVLNRINAIYFVDDRHKHVLAALRFAPGLLTVFHMNEVPILKPWRPGYVHARTWATIMELIQ